MRKKKNKLRPAVVSGLASKTVLILLGSLVFLNCKENMEWTVEFDKEAFYREWAAWEAQGIKDYTVNRKTVAYEEDEMFVRLHVKDNACIMVEPLDGTNGGNGFTISESYQGIENWYKLLLEIPPKFKYPEPEYLKIIYNKDFHYPEYIENNSPWDPHARRDGYFYVYYSEFMPLASELEE